MPFRRGLWKTNRSHARPDRAKHRALTKRKALPALPFRELYPAGTIEAPALAAACIPKIRTASRRARLGPVEAVAKESTGDGGAAPKTRAKGSRGRNHAGGRNKAPSRWLASGLCAARILSAGKCCDSARSCCGALLVHAGEEAAALELAKKTIDAFEGTNVDAIVSNAAGCGSNVKDYAYLLRDDPAYADRARSFSAKCKDVSEILAGLEPRAARHPLKLRVAFHDSCHLQHAQGVRSQPRALLSKIPGLQLAEIPESAICCGSAGIYNLVQPDAADAIGDRKAMLIAPLKADMVATGNPGCLLQLQSSLSRNGHQTPVVHTIQLLDASIRGTTLETLLK